MEYRRYRRRTTAGRRWDRVPVEKLAWAVQAVEHQKQSLQATHGAVAE